MVFLIEVACNGILASTSTGCSWLSAVEMFFSKPTRHRLERGASVAELCQGINSYIETYNENPNALIWNTDLNYTAPC